MRWLVAGLGFRRPPLAAALGPARRLVTHPDADVRYSLTGLLAMYVPATDAVDGLLALAADDEADGRFGTVYELHAHVREGWSDARVLDALRNARHDVDESVRNVVSRRSAE